MGENMVFAEPLERLAENFRKLPGIGKKSSYRMAFSVLDLTDEEIQAFAKALYDAKASTRRCSVCQNITSDEICPLCLNKKRDKRLICVVENPRDVAAIERINEYNGVFHVLHGVISPLDGVGPDDLTVKELLLRVQELLSEEPDSPVEVIVATNPSVEGETTAMYISRILKVCDIKVSRLAYGIPVGADLEYADNVTLCRAIEGRREM